MINYLDFVDVGWVFAVVHVFEREHEGVRAFCLDGDQVGLLGRVPLSIDELKIKLILLPWYLQCRRKGPLWGPSSRWFPRWCFTLGRFPWKFACRNQPRWCRWLCLFRSPNSPPLEGPCIKWIEKAREELRQSLCKQPRVKWLKCWCWKEGSVFIALYRTDKRRFDCDHIRRRWPH